MKMRNIVLALMAIACVVSYSVSGFDLSTQYVVATLAATAVSWFLPSVNLNSAHDLTGFRCDDLVGELSAKLKTALTDVEQKQKELREQGEEYKRQLASNVQISPEFKKSIDDNIVAVGGLQSSVDEVKQKLAEIAQSTLEQKKAPEAEKSLGQLFVESDGFKSMMERGFTGATRFEQKAITTATGSAGALVRKPYQDSMVNLERERLTIRDLLTVIPVQESSIEYAQQNLRTNAAAPVAEGAAKPYSNYGWILKTANVKVIAHLTKITKQAASDAPRLMAEIDSEMRYGLDLVEESQLLYGNGTGENINGIMPQATAYALPAGVAMPAGATRLDVLRMAILQNSLAKAPADGIVLNPVDWTLIELLKDDNNAYLFANIQGTVEPRVWGKRVVETPAMAIDDFLVGAFKYGANLYDRWTTEVLLSSENADDFEKNLMTMRAEKRIGLGVRRPYAFTKGDFESALTP